MSCNIPYLWAWQSIALSRHQNWRSCWNWLEARRYKRSEDNIRGDGAVDAHEIGCLQAWWERKQQQQQQQQ